MPYMHFWNGGGWFFPPIFFIMIVIGLVVCLFFLFGRKKLSDPESPLDILKRRYAKGEITRDEFQRMKEDIGK
ncbi:MAG: SHOCT domain-containing protein [Deltaproteobacteria bacterium]|nr:SHOCT domain-containing protein [Deltaproteobacteria bacterium]